MITRIRRAQSILEYAALITIISVGLGAMVFYMQRGLQVRIRHLNQELNDGSR
ncbi:MAG: hypothetical protein ABH865_01410 [Candidatus Omnitrophota bacterium]|nr:hypothetical protein [Candidatus Omnitrophota bacterium]